MTLNGQMHFNKEGKNTFSSKIHNFTMITIVNMHIKKFCTKEKRAKKRQLLKNKQKKK